MILKTTFLATILLTAFIAYGATTLSNTPPVTISGVSIAKDTRTLVIHYELAGRSHVQRVAFTNDITDFRYCCWLGDQGIAVVASTRGDEFYYATLFLTGRGAPVSPYRIPAPTSKSVLLGIANTGGDSIVVTAVQHRRDRSGNRLSGWMFIDNCPPIGAMISGWVIPFDIEQSFKTK